MSDIRLSTIFIAIFISPLVGPQNCCAQLSESPSLAERIHDGSDEILVLNDLQVVVDDIRKLMTDLGFGSMSDAIREYIHPEPDSGIANEDGAVIYGPQFFGNAIAQMQVGDRTRLPNTLDAPPDRTFAGDESWYDIGNAGPLRMFGQEFQSGMVTGNRLVVCAGKSRTRAEEILAAPLLTERLDKRARDIINQSGITLIGSGKSVDLGEALDIESVIRDSTDRLTESGQEWLEEFAQVASKAELAVLGLKYQNEMLELRGRAQIEDLTSFDGLLELAQTERDWRPDLGLELQRLVVAGAIQMDVFRSSAGARVIPQTLLRGFGRRQQFRFLHGNMLNLLLELAGDSWNELRAGRIALYVNQDVEQQGQLAIIGVVDSNDPDQVMSELARLSQLTRPDEDATTRGKIEQEIARLVRELGSLDSNTAARAETRLKLAGPMALPALEEIAHSKDDALRRRADRILRQLKNRSPRDASRVADPWFWTTLNPGLRLVESTGSMSGFTAHTVEVTPDPSKTPDEVEEAVAVMQSLFGPNWNVIRFVQVRQHFVFMIGSNDELLQRIVSHVDTGSTFLMKSFDNVGQGLRQGQLQVFVNTTGLRSLMREPATGVDGSWKDQLCWTGLAFEHNAASLEALIPVKQIIPFVMMGF